MEREIKKRKGYLKEINQLVTQIVGINDKELSDKACKILNKRRDLLFNIHIDNDYHIQIDNTVVNSLKTIINDYMKTKELKITPPEGYEIDKENSTFDCIKFKPVVKRWRDEKYAKICGYFINVDASIVPISQRCNVDINYNIFANERQAKSALAMARISQIMANDKRFGGVITDEEWNSSRLIYTIERVNDSYTFASRLSFYSFLGFHTPKQRDLFLKENEDLVKDYLMID